MHVMPTPFSHLHVAQRLLTDPALPDSLRRLLAEHRGAFLLGSVAADARVGAGTPREHTHFYIYGQDIVDHPWRVMLREYPGLLRPHDSAHRAFVAGYVAHLAMDEFWSLNMVVPHFVRRDWGTRALRFLMLHIILIYMDERDLGLLESWQPEALRTAQVNGWLPFMTDVDLAFWQTLIYDQIRPGGQSETLEIFGARISHTPAELRAILDSEARMQADLWDHIPLAVLNEVERGMYAFLREQTIRYFDESSPDAPTSGTP